MGGKENGFHEKQSVFLFIVSLPPPPTLDTGKYYHMK